MFFRVFLFLCIAATSFAEKKTICLNMIVKNEKDCIIDCLSSVKDKIDYWVICDTGSTDGTQDVIREFMKDIPGELHQRPWVDFAHNRNEALRYAKKKADYSLFIDADEQWLFSNDQILSHLDKDFYVTVVREPQGIDYHRIGLVNNKKDWKWVGVVHESLECAGAEGAVLDGVVNLSDTRKGNRSKSPCKYLKDALVLELALIKEPNHARYRYYLGQSYHNAGALDLALKNFELRADMEIGCEQERFFSMFRVAQLRQILGAPDDVVVQSYLKAYRYRPSRSEPLFYLAKFYLQSQQYKKAYDLLKVASSIPLSHDGYFVEKWIYDWGSLYFFAESCLRLERKEELKQVIDRLFLCKALPPECLQTVKKVASEL